MNKYPLTIFLILGFLFPLGISAQGYNLKQLNASLKRADQAGRQEILRQASQEADGPFYSEMLRTAQKAKAPIQTDILDFLREEAKDPARSALIRKGELRYDLTNVQVLKKLSQSKDLDVVLGSAMVLSEIQEPSAVSFLCGMLKGEDPRLINIAYEALENYKGKIDSEVAKAIPSASTSGQILGIRLLAQRKASTHMGTVLRLLESGDKSVRDEAFASLKYLVTKDDRTKMCGLLEEAQEEYIPYLQEAVMATLQSETSGMTPAIQQRMLLAGRKSLLYYPILAKTGEARALDLITQGIGSGTEESRKAALDALGEWNGKEGLESLLKIAQSHEDANVRNKALERAVTLCAGSNLTKENQLILLRDAMELAQDPTLRHNIMEEVASTGTFTALVYACLLLDDEFLQEDAAKAAVSIISEHPEYQGETLNPRLERAALLSGDQQVRRMLEESRTSAGFRSLFNGKDLAGWKGLVENPIKRARLTKTQLQSKQQAADKEMLRNWSVVNGCLAYTGTGYDNLCTERQYRDFELYLDWKLDPSGKEPDAGVYLRGTPQVQIWDTSRTDVGAEVGSGGLYNNKIATSTPLEVADNPTGQWNTMHIIMRGDKVTVHLNGHLVTDAVTLENYWDRSQPVPDVEQIELQAHGSLVYFRDIYLRELD